MEKLDQVRAKIVEAPCWEWPGHLTKQGYARRKKDGKQINVHRAIFEAVIKDIPEGWVIDHLCRNRGCVNPFHLEAVTSRENVLRGVGISANNYHKTVCKRGHSLNLSKNVRVNSSGARVCVPCVKIREAGYKNKKLI